MSLVTRTAFPLPMQYLGSKQRIAGWILEEIQSSFPQASTLFDLMSGSGAIAHEANMRGWNVHTNDIQPYSYQVLKSAFTSPRDGLQELIDWFAAGGLTDVLLDGGRASAKNALREEDDFAAGMTIGDFDWHLYKEFCSQFSGSHTEATGDFDLFSTYYPNTYFGVRQCLEIDAIRSKAESVSESAGTHLIGALISSLTFVSSTTTHLAQFLKPNSHASATSLLTRRSMSIEAQVVRRLRLLQQYPTPKVSSTMNLGFQEALTTVRSDSRSTVVYADPPYFKEHYSRYYHVLDTVALYDYPELTYNNRLNSVTIGRYRTERIVSDFGLRSKVADAFSEMFGLAKSRGFEMALSYASTSLLPADDIVKLAERVGYSADLKEIELKHSGQGQIRAKNDVTEYLFLLHHE